MIIIIFLIVLFLPSIVNIINWYFEFINPSCILNSKKQPCQKLLKRYRKRFYQQKIKIRKFIPTNNQLLENTDEVTRPMTKQHPEISQDLFFKFMLLPCSKEILNKNKVWHWLFQYLCRFWYLVLYNTWWDWSNSRYL